MHPRSQQGATVVELLIAGSISAILVGLCTSIFLRGAHIWAKVESQSDVLQEMQVVVAKFHQFGGASRIHSVTADTDSGVLAFPSASDEAGNSAIDGDSGQAIWYRYDILYYDAAERAMYFRELPIVTPTTDPERLVNYDDGSGQRPLSFYKSRGRSLAKDIVEMDTEVDGGVVHLRLKGERRRAGSERPELLEIEGRVYPRN